MKRRTTVNKKKARRAGAPILLQSADAELFLRVIRAKCLDCCCGSKKMVKQCKTYDCQLYPFRCCGAFTQTDLFDKEE